MIWNGMLFWDPQMSAAANVIFLTAPILLALLAVPTVLFYHLCRCCGLPFHRKGWLAYLVLSVLLTLLEMEQSISGIASLLPEIALLALTGCILLRQRWIRALTASVLAASVQSICSGTVQWLEYLLMWKMGPLFYSIPPCMDLLREFLGIFLLIGIFHWIWKSFFASFWKNGEQELILLVIPAFFIALVERTVRDSIYGDTIVGNSEQGILFPVVDHGEIFFIQIFACACLFLILAAYRKITDALEAQQALRSFRQQEQAQKIYVQEAFSRYEKTRSFRHDIKGHLTVLAGLIRTGENDEARRYLEKMGQVCQDLSYPVQTGNAAVDALLGSKLWILEQEGIALSCTLRLPEGSGVSDMDWCIVLANALDNASAAARSLPPEERRIRLTGRKKGNIYLLSIENTCERSIQDVPEDGIGLANIRAAVARYQGTATISVGDGTFRLDLLWVLPGGDGVGVSIHNDQDASRTDPLDIRERTE